ncbi:Cation efflux family protein [Pelomyxa schiedti]|nr:Cation efflux family protein [Pelomyxa schiedti]
MVVSLCVDVVGAFLFHKQVRNLNLSVKGINTKREPLIGYQMASHEDTFLLVFFHALGHAFRNAGIILSYVMATTWGWQLADPLMSLFISLILVVTTIPVVIKHGKLLLQITPSTIYPKIYDATQAASMVEGVLEIRNEHFWTLSPGIYVGSLCVRVRSDASEEKIRQQIRGLYQNWLTHLTIEIDKDVWESIGGGAVGEQRHHRVFRQGGPIVGVTSSIGPGHL